MCFQKWRWLLLPSHYKSQDGVKYSQTSLSRQSGAPELGALAESTDFMRFVAPILKVYSFELHLNWREMTHKGWSQKFVLWKREFSWFEKGHSQRRCTFLQKKDLDLFFSCFFKDKVCILTCVIQSAALFLVFSFIWTKTIFILF